MRSALGYSARGEGTDTLELDIYDVVGADFWGDGVSAQSFRRILKNSPQAKLIKLRINSEGGDVFDGFAIYNLLKDHPARVEVDIDALAASIASVIAMAADEIRIASNAFLMIHNPWGFVRGESDHLRTWADLLDKMRDNAADIYAARSKQAREKVLELMAAETWMTAAEAKALGFVDTVTPLKASSTSAKAAARTFACMSLDEYSNVPAGVREAVEAARAARNQTTSPEVPADANNRDPGTETDDMEDTLKAFLTTHGITSAELNQMVGLSVKLGAKCGKKGDDLHGLLMAALASHEALPGLQTQVTELQTKVAEQTAKAEAQELEAAFAEAKQAKKLTPAYETELRRQLAAKEITLAGVKATLKMLHPVGALAAAPITPPAPTTGAATSGGAPEVLKHNGKAWEEMSPAQKHNLHVDNREVYDALKANHEQRKKG